jgi:hypothetical protein
MAGGQESRLRSENGARCEALRASGRADPRLETVLNGGTSTRRLVTDKARSKPRASGSR